MQTMSSILASLHAMLATCMLNTHYKATGQCFKISKVSLLSTVAVNILTESAATLKYDIEGLESSICMHDR